MTLDDRSAHRDNFFIFETALAMIELFRQAPCFLMRLDNFSFLQSLSYKIRIFI